jgi:hypothetical protein
VCMLLTYSGHDTFIFNSVRRSVAEPSWTNKAATEKCRERGREVVLSLGERMKRCARTGRIFKHRSLADALLGTLI